MGKVNATQFISANAECHVRPPTHMQGEGGAWSETGMISYFCHQNRNNLLKLP